jgi:hypothetical protein
MVTMAIFLFGDMLNKISYYPSIKQFKIKQKIMKIKQLWLWANLAK